MVTLRNISASFIASHQSRIPVHCILLCTPCVVHTDRICAHSGRLLYASCPSEELWRLADCARLGDADGDMTEAARLLRQVRACDRANCPRDRSVSGAPVVWMRCECWRSDCRGQIFRGGTGRPRRDAPNRALSSVAHRYSALYGAPCGAGGTVVRRGACCATARLFWFVSHVARGHGLALSLFV